MSKDPHNIHHRINNQIHLILLELEEAPERFALKERLSVVQIVGMFLTRDVKLRAADESDRPAGGAIRKYAGAFKTNVAHKREGGSRAPAVGYDPDTGADDPDAA